MDFIKVTVLGLVMMYVASALNSSLETNETSVQDETVNNADFHDSSSSQENIEDDACVPLGGECVTFPVDINAQYDARGHKCCGALQCMAFMSSPFISTPDMYKCFDWRSQYDTLYL
uniref:Uncharacterized protein n=1 Tax=Clastoptera arizonana TaxID=38151 RepID=A0A1B6DNN8_9HEMI